MRPTSFLYGYLGDHSPSLRGRGRGRGQLGEMEGPTLVGILTMQTGNVKIFHRLFPSTIENGLSLKHEEALLRSRTCLSCHKKGIFYEQEGHILERKT